MLDNNFTFFSRGTENVLSGASIGLGLKSLIDLNLCGHFDNIDTLYYTKRHSLDDYLSLFKKGFTLAYNHTYRLSVLGKISHGWVNNAMYRQNSGYYASWYYRRRNLVTDYWFRRRGMKNRFM